MFPGFVHVTYKNTMAHIVICRQDGRGRFPVYRTSKCRANSQKEIPTELEFDML